MCQKLKTTIFWDFMENILKRIFFDFLAAQQLRRDMLLSALTMPSSGLFLSYIKIHLKLLFTSDWLDEDFYEIQIYNYN